MAQTEQYLYEVFPQEILDMIYSKIRLNVGVMGAPGVGKTNLINRILDQPFEKKYNPTQGIEITDGETFKFFDFAGQEMYGNFDQEIIDSLDICIIVYDITSKISKNQIKTWKNKLNPKTKVITVGNKIDMKPNQKFDSNVVSCRSKINLEFLVKKMVII
tara:strand:- start:227 stop:706 length:480 start_codon:yes stop_codon:yes gene_type:complete